MNLKQLSSLVVKKATSLVKDRLNDLAIDLVVLVIDMIKEAVIAELSKD